MRCHAKINLSLAVLNKRDDGYHNIDTIMQKIELHDILKIEVNDKNSLIIESNSPHVPLGEDNLIHKVWRILSHYVEGDIGITAHIEKHIPIGAGLAGGSSNAHGMFVLLNKLWDLNLSDDELMELSKPLGADIPFFFGTNTMRARGIGNELEELDSFADRCLLLVNPNVHISTPDVYGRIILGDGVSRIDDVVDAMSRSLKTLGKTVYNDMEPAAEELCGEIGKIRVELIDTGADVVLMSGSGATVFGIYENETDLEIAYDKFDYPYLIKTKTV